MLQNYASQSSILKYHFKKMSVSTVYREISTLWHININKFYFIRIDINYTVLNIPLYCWVVVVLMTTWLDCIHF